MFKSRKSGGLQSKLAHTTILPAFGNKDLRTLQDFITAEKGIVSGLQRLATDWGKAGDALRTWGVGEGDDLGDIFSQAAAMFSQVSHAMDQFAVHQQSIRTYLKSIRTKEEELDELRKRRRNVGSKAESAEKKLAKMSQEHKGLHEQTDLLTRLREEMKSLDLEIITEETRIGDFKRLSSKELLALKFGSLLEFAEKAAVVGEMGKLLIQEIPLDTTIPGQPRALYNAHQKTFKLTEETTRCIQEVKFDPPTYALGHASETQSIPRQSIPDFSSEDPMVWPMQKHVRVNSQSTTIPNSPYSMTNPGQHLPGGTPHNASVGEFGEAPRPPVHQQYSTIGAPTFLPVSPNNVQSYSQVPSAPGASYDRTSGDHFATFPLSNARRGVVGFQPQQNLLQEQTSVPFFAPKPELAFSETIADALAADTYLRTSVDGAPPDASGNSAYGGMSDTKVDTAPPNPYDEHDKLVSPPVRNASRQATGLPYVMDPAPAGRRGKGSSEFNYPYEDNAFFVRNHATSALPPNEQDPSMVKPDASYRPHVPDQVSPPPPPPPLPASQDEKASIAASREVARELDSLGFRAGRSRSNTPDSFPAVPLPPHPGLLLNSSSRPASPLATDVLTLPKSEPAMPISQKTQVVPSNAPPLADPSLVSLPYNQPPNLCIHNPAPPLPSPLATSGPLGARTVSAGAFRRQATRPPAPEDDGDRNSDNVSVTLVSTSPLRLRGKNLPAVPGAGKDMSPTTNTSVASEGLQLGSEGDGMDAPPVYTQRDSPRDGRPKVDSLLANEEEFMKELEGESFPPGGGSPYPPPDRGGPGGFPSSGYGSGQFSTNLE